MTTQVDLDLRPRDPVCRGKFHLPRFDIVLATGERLEGVTITGAIDVDAARTVRRCQLMAARGRPLPVPEPEPGHIAIWLREHMGPDGEERNVPLAGTTFRLACCGREKIITTL